MKKLFSIVLMMFCALTISAQTDVTTFLGIPVDGFKADMRKKLIAKGFTPTTYNEDVLEGEFNGHDVYVHIATNNNKVWRIMVADKNGKNETDIKIRFNKLVRQFENNERYKKPFDSVVEAIENLGSNEEGGYIIPEEEDISYEMSVNNKRYEAIFCQVLDKSIKEAIPISEEEVIKYLKALEIENPTEEVKKNAEDLIRWSISYNMEEKKSVWFMICEDGGKYYIAMYYDNKYNEANGEDL